MRGAPPVQMACGRDARAAGGAAALSATAAASLAGWLAWHGTWPVPLAAFVVIVCGLLAAVVGWRRVMAEGERRLAWDGRAWALDGMPGEVAVMIDTGGWLLLRFQSAAACRWLSLRPARCGAPAHLARAALQAHAGRAAAGGLGGFERHG